ncbi:hypothetical protein [Ruegeria sp. Ofav3-42]|uniref:hypothetical protein n=1 Tax=Ruegeria sp. Ofav3-42 TaxID=2917759 RepID=UPI001EF42C31|nr:hypothetical protein [Ruegeria sp. Ofav3-42]MCG7518451.1 hypothetical protein [Ruegeria sp. Ofav3-42]
MNYSWCEIYLLAKDWQTLIGALTALVAALLTIAVMLWQASSERKRHRNQLKRKNLAARARMPDALAEVTEYAQRVGKFLTGQIDDRPEGPQSESIQTLKQVIEHIDDDAAARTFELVSWYQVQRVRFQDNESPLNDTGSLYEVVRLQAYVNSLFDYARDQSQTVSNDKPSQDEMMTAKHNVFDLQYVMANEAQFNELDQRIQRQH